MIKYKDAQKYEPRKHNNFDVESGKSNTIPGQAYTVKQIKEMVKRGINIDLMRKGIYEIEKNTDLEEMNPIRKQNFDLSDIDIIKDFIDKGMESIDRIKKVQESKKNEAKKAKEKEDIIREYLSSIKKDVE